MSQDTSRSQVTGPEWVTAPWWLGRTKRAYFSSRPPWATPVFTLTSASRCAISSADSSTVMLRVGARASMAMYNTTDEIDRLADALEKVKRLFG